MQIFLDVEEAVGRLEGNYKWHISEDLAKVAIANRGHHSGMTTEELATLLFQGDGNIPPRPAFEDYLNTRREWLKKELRKFIRITKKPSTTKTYIADIYVTLDTDQLANEVRTDVYKWIASGSYYKSAVPNAYSTIQHKGSDVPLVETGALLDSLYADTVKSK